MRRQNFTETVRSKLKVLGSEGRPVKIAELADALDMISNKEKRPLYRCLDDMRDSGEVERVETGVVIYRGKDAPPDIRSAMWSVIRMRKVVTVGDLIELSGASESYAKEFVGLLVRRGCVERIGRGGQSPTYRLINDIGPQTPADTAKSDRLHHIREAKKLAIAQLDEAGKALVAATHAIVRARMAVVDIQETEVGDG
jgi:hypothetical protein